jgi:hypothetical protein
MEKTFWKALAIIFFIIVFLETFFIIYSIASVNSHIEKQNTCFYDICEGYPDAYYDSYNKVCTCYEYDIIGDLIVGKEKYMK